MKRYILHPGWVPSGTGGAMFISSADLARLYRVKRSECWVASPQVFKALTPEQFAQLVHLYPSQTGVYTPPPRG